MPAFSDPSGLTGNPVLDAVDSGKRWSGEITYNRVDVPDAAEVTRFGGRLPAPYLTNGEGLTDAIWNLVSRSLAVLQTYANFSYALTNTIDANYMVSDFYNPNNASNPGIAAEPGNGPIVGLNPRTWDSYSDQQQEWIVLHELGHTLGLHHVSGLPVGLDYSQYSIMSYNWYQLGDQYYGEGLPLTPKALDIAVLQAKYGAATANVGATTYSLANFGEDRDGADGFVRNGRGYICIWDSAGIDTISYVGFSSSLINLNAAILQTASPTGDLADLLGDIALTSRVFARLSAATQAEITDPNRTAGGFFSSILVGDHRDVGGYTIANGARVESATGGFGDDLLIGNAFDNSLAGGGGKDDLFGGSGADTLDGGAGDDQAFGGLGADSITDSGGGANYLRGDEGDDQIIGAGGFDDINGNMGDDTAAGGLGDDWVVGGKDNDLLSGGDGGDLVYGNLGADTIAGDGGADIVRGGQQDDVLSGGAGDDYLSGDRDNDTMTGGAGADVFHTFGEAGLDRVLDFNLAEGDRVQLDPGTTYAVSQAGVDTLIAMGGGGQMLLVGVQMSSLTGSWIFGA